MKKMQKYVVALVLAVMLGVGSIAQSALVTITSDKLDLDVGVLLQTLGFFEYLDDPYKNDTRIYLFQKAARIRMYGTYGKTEFEFQYATGGEVKDRDSNRVPFNSPLGLLDASVDMAICDSLKVKVGQFKVPYSRERLTDAGDIRNTDRSIQHLAFNVGRDVGVAVHGYAGNFAGALGVFTGGGIDHPVRSIPQEIQIPVIALRVGFNSGLDENIFKLGTVDFNNKETRYAVFVNGIYTRDSQVGHGRLITKRKYTDNSFLIDSNWNPYTSSTDYATLKQGGVDLSVLMPVGNSILALDAEVNGGSFSNNTGKITLAGGVVGAHLYTSEIFGLGVRAATILPDKKMANGSNLLFATNDDPIYEISPTMTFNFRKSGIMIKMDCAFGIDTPISTDAGFGVFNLMLQPDQTSDPVTRDETVTGKILLQFLF